MATLEDSFLTDLDELSDNEGALSSLEWSNFAELLEKDKLIVNAFTSNILRCGGWDGEKWLSVVYVMDTMSLEWMELSVSGSLPPPKCGHTATMVEKRLAHFFSSLKTLNL